MRVTSKGQITIPARIRKRVGLLPHTEIECLFNGTGVRIVRAAATKPDSKGVRVVAHLRSHPGDIPMTTDAIIALTRGE
jgi:AbrB family looped-hinge helix DNA binding protein